MAPQVSFAHVPANHETLLMAMSKGFKIEPALVEIIEKCVEIDIAELKEAKAFSSVAISAAEIITSICMRQWPVSQIRE